MNVSGAEAEFAGSRPQQDVFGVVELLELLGDFEGAVGGGIVHDDDFVVELVFGEGTVEEPDDYWEVAALVVLGALCKWCGHKSSRWCSRWVGSRYTCLWAPCFRTIERCSIATEL